MPIRLPYRFLKVLTGPWKEESHESVIVLVEYVGRGKNALAGADAAMHVDINLHDVLTGEMFRRRPADQSARLHQDLFILLPRRTEDSLDSRREQSTCMGRVPRRQRY